MLLFLYLGRVVLKELRHRLIQVLLLLVRLGLLIDGLADNSSPDKVLLGGVIHIDVELANINRRGLPGRYARRHSTGAVPATSVPARAVSPRRVVGGELLLLSDACLVSDIQVG